MTASAILAMRFKQMLMGKSTVATRTIAKARTAVLVFVRI
jgi:hypothetical protein